VKNRRTGDFRNWILSLGHQHPAVTLMQIQATPPEVLMANSAKAGDGKRTMTYGEANALRVRCAEAIMPFLESKQPVAVDMNFSGVSDLIMAGVTHTDAEVQDILDAEFIPWTMKGMRHEGPSAQADLTRAGGRCLHAQSRVHLRHHRPGGQRQDHGRPAEGFASGRDAEGHRG
jgi:Mrp family chromosome partitioning ATPase